MGSPFQVLTTGQQYIPCHLLGQQHYWVRSEKVAIAYQDKPERRWDCWTCFTCWTRYEYPHGDCK